MLQTIVLKMNLLTLWPWPLTFQPKNHTTSRIPRGHSLYQVWTFWEFSFLTNVLIAGYKQMDANANSDHRKLCFQKMISIILYWTSYLHWSYTMYLCAAKYIIYLCWKLTSPFWTIILIVTIVYFDYVQRSCRSLYRILRFTNCPTYITFNFHLLTLSGGDIFTNFLQYYDICMYCVYYVYMSNVSSMMLS